MMSQLSVWVWPAAFAVWVLGVALGLWTGHGRGYDKGYDAAIEDAEADRKEARAQWGPRLWTIRDRRLLARALADLTPPEVAHEWDAHAAQAVALATESDEEWMARNFAADHAFADQPMTEPAFPPWSLLNADPPTFDEEIQAMIANANANPSVRWLDQLPAGELWDRQ